VSAQKWVAFSGFGCSGCSVWVKENVGDVVGVTGDVCGEEMVRFCEILPVVLLVACVVLIFAFFLFLVSSGHCDVAMRGGEPIPRC
jgi:hypothetical protein